MGTFVFEDGRYVQVVRVPNQEVSFALFPSGEDELTDAWIQKMSVRCRQFIDRFDSQVDAIGENVRCPAKIQTESVD